MTFEEYTNNKKKKKKNAEGLTFTEYTKSLLGEDVFDDDIAPVKNTFVTTEKEKDKEDKKDKEDQKWYQGWLKKSESFDGNSTGIFDTLGDVVETGISTVADAGVGIVKGAVGSLEGITDFLSYGVGQVADWVGAEGTAEYFRNEAKANTTEYLLGGVHDYFKKSSVLGERSDQITGGLGQVGLIMATGGLGAYAGLGKLGVTALTSGVMGTSSAGSGTSQAYSEGASDSEAMAYGISKGVIDAGSEMIFGGLGKAVNAVGYNTGLSQLDDMFAQKLSSKISNQVAKNWVEYGVKAGAEGFEEVVAGVGSAVAKKLTYADEETLRELIEDEDLLDQFIVGMAVSGMAQSGYIPMTEAGSLKEANKTGTDFITGLTPNETNVVEAEVENRIKEQEANGNKLSNKEKSNIREQVMSDLKKGYISLDTIESTLGGETFESYKSLTERENLLREEIIKLQSDPRPTAQNRLTEAKAELEAIEKGTEKTELKDRLSLEVQELAKNDRLGESYNEKARRSQSFEADLTKYDAKQQETVKKAVESGILNNTNKTHEFVDLLAKLSADKGVSFDFTNNENLKKSGFALDGVTVNGLVTEDGNIILNTESAKALNTVVGHEITHVLEGTELYTELQNAVKQYAETKGEYNKRLQEITKLYKGRNANIENELTAELVGEYLFTDSDFINNLSVKKPNVFKKIYDEIKYLLKVATAGSKEARELEKVKRAFDNAYKQNGKAEGNTKYSLSDTDGRTLTEEQAEYLKDSVVRDEKGNLKVMYHGTSNGGHTVFDPYGKAKYGLFGTGTYFTDNKSVAESYTEKGKGNNKQVYETYLNIKNPIDMDAQGDYEAWKKALPEANFPKEGTNEDYYRAMEEYFEDNEFPKWEASQTAMEVIESMGYDGITHIGGGRFNKADDTRHRVYIAFESEQIKSVDNATPTNSPDIRYSLSEDSNGNSLNIAIQKRFANSKAVDENGNLKVLYHGTPSGEFTIFDKTKGSVTGDFGSGFYFTDNEADVETNYEGGGPDFENKVARRAEQIEYEEDIDYEEAEQRAREELYVGSNKFEVYLNIENPAIVGETVLFEQDAYLEQYDPDDFDDYDDYIAEVEQFVADEIDSIVWEVERNVGIEDDTNDLRNILYEAYYAGGLEIEKLKSRINDFYFEDSEGNLANNEITRQIIESLGYDGIIDNTVSSKFKNMGLEEGTTHYIVFKPNQIKSITNQNPTDNPDINLSLSEENQTVTSKGNYNVYGKDIALETVQEDISKTETATMPEVADEYAPITDTSEIDAQQSDRLNTLDESQMPEETEAPYYETEDFKVEDPFADRDIKEVGKRNVNAYMYDNPEVRPYFQAEARAMLGDLRQSIKGERQFNDHLYYETGGEKGWFGNKRFTTPDIEYLLDEWGYSYAEIEKGLNAIIEDHGAENIAVAKRIEFLIDEKLRNGYTDFFGNVEVPPNQEYLDLLADKQMNDYQDEAYNQYLDSLAQEYSSQENAPVKQQYEAIEPAPQKLDALEEQWAKNKMARVDSKVKGKTESQEIAKILDTEPKTESQRNKRKWAVFRANVFDKGTPFEDLSLKTKNRELMGKWDYTLTSEARAQYLMHNGDAKSGVKSLNEIMEEVENTNLTKEFYEYMYHKHNADRMTLKERYGTDNKAVFGDSVTAEVSQEIVDQYEFAQPKFMDFAQDVYNYQTYLRKQLVDKGVISQETADLWQDMYPHYVPIRRVDSTGKNIDVPLDTGRTGVNAPIKRATGGNSDILPLFDTMALRTLQTYKATAKNSFGVELKNTLGTTIENTATNVDEVINSIETQESLLQEGKNGRRPTFTVFENGERVTFEITEDMYDALKPISDSSLLSKTIKPLNVASNIHRGLLTEYNPVFMITNGIKDIQDVLINSQHPARTYAKIPEAFAQIVKKGYWYSEYMANGGEQNSFFDSETNTFKTENKGIAKLLDIPPLSTISKMNNYIEMIPRLAEYIASRESGRSIEVSMLDGARVTTNFKAGGDLTKWANRNGATFLNASVQGAMQQVRNVREAKANGLKGWANLATKFALAGLPAYLLNALMWEDDEEYEELADYVKQNYYVVWKNEDGTFLRIPKGRTVAVIQDAIKQISNVATGNDEADLKSFLELVVTNIAPANPIENNILAPIIQVANNETWYGEDLVPTRLQDLPASEQYDESTDSVSKWLGEKLNISPIKINYLLDQYSGGVGDVVLPMLTPEAETGDNSLAGNLLAPLKSKFTTDSTMNNQNVSDFYEISDELATNSKGSGATDKDILANKYINSVKSEMSELYKQKREIQSSNMSDAVKYDKVREVQNKIVELAKKGLKSYENVKIEGNYATVGDVQFKLNESGEWQKISADQLEKQDEVINSLGISASEYWGNKEEYDYAYKYPEKASVVKALGGYEKYKSYATELNDITADKDENGKTINGSRKEKVVNYINTLNADYGEKLILFKSEYPADDTYNNDIIEYLNNRDDITYDEMESILKALGFTVDSKGNISW